MCPACLATAVWIAAGATSTGGITALVVKKLVSKNAKSKSITTREGGSQ